MRILLTGATGFIGRPVLARLAGHKVLCLSREPRNLPVQHGVTMIAASLAKPDTWEGAVAAFAPECCVHLAWEGLPDYSFERCRANLDASLRLLGVLGRARVSRIVVAGSCWEYGDASGPVSETATAAEMRLFAATKDALFSILASLAAQSALEYRWARIFFVYGPGQRPTSLIPSTRAACLADRGPEIREPSAVHDFIHIDDVADGLVSLALANVPSGIYNLGTGRPTSVAEVANKVAAYCGRPRPFADVTAGAGFWADTVRMRAATGWSARIDIDGGIQTTLQAMDRTV